MSDRVTIQVSTTGAGERAISLYPLNEVTEIICDKKSEGGGGDVDVAFHFCNGDIITVCGAFSMGYGGTGPNGLHDIMVRCGISSYDADYVFSCVTKGKHKFSKTG